MLDDTGVAARSPARDPRRTGWRGLIAVAALLAACTAGADEPSSAADVIRNLNTSFEELLRDSEKLGYAGRLERLSPVIDNTFDLEFMARTAIGRQWGDLGEADRKRWIDAFARLTKANYAGRFDHFSGQKFEFLGEEPSANDTEIVRTRVIDPGKESVDINYRLRKGDAGWKVIDIYLKGTVSELALRRSEYSALLKREGFEALIASIDRKIAELESGAAPAK
jgi:phospholipid transport system substrate-binding protein